MPIDKSHGYEYYNIENRGRVYVHRWVMEQHIGRILNKNECVHHIDGNIHNNTIENLELLSLAEHALLESVKRGGEPIRYGFCKDCGKEIVIAKDKKTEYCIECFLTKHQNKLDITHLELEKLVNEMPMTKISKILGVSDKSVKNYCDKFGIKIPPIGFWVRKNNS